jgi:hypothetical protein
MTFKIIEVKNKKQLKDFINLVFMIYEQDPYWVAPLIKDQMDFFNPKKNPYFAHSEVKLFIAKDEHGKTVGRISAHTNTQHNHYHNEKTGFFGFFEAIDNQELTHLLFETAANFLKTRDCETIRGPFNFSTNEECGMLIDGFYSSPFIMMLHHPHYYQNLLENEGFGKAKDLYAWLLEYNSMPEFLRNLGEKIIAKEPSFKVRSLDKNNLKAEIETVFTIYQKAWESNWGFVPMTRAEFDHTVKSLLPVVVPELVYIAEVDGVPAGFSVTLPDYNFVLQKMKGRIFPFGILKALYYKNKIKSLRVITMGVIHEFQNRGIDILFYYYSWQKGLDLKFNRGEFSWVLEDNEAMNKIAKHLGAHIHKTYRIFEKGI